MSEEGYGLLLLHHVTRSRARRVYKFFKPSEIVSGEPFDIDLLFRNDGDVPFPGGKITIQFEYGPDVLQEAEKELPRISPGETGKLIISSRIPSTGVCVLKILAIVASDGKRVKCVDSENRSVIYWEHETAIPFDVVSKEEIYQKYSFLVALCALFISLTALIIAVAEFLD
jgi:hypothetical protein